MANTDKRRNWTPEEDVVLLINSPPTYPLQLTRVKLRSPGNPWRTKEHRKFDMASAKLSGVDQEELEKHTLLDDLLPLLDFGGLGY
ncbi:hypothetical protein H257_03830 [Aphanomyces astaci]|uniref:Uncharacterized protein n=1 Tax=Aphanomyces astaci TaxID=112090 RepID=W4GZF2_APHAT|nr:hypothetical protein H257_03830 [Aphanomyces astaci]ETV84706.1 hypothetical protein H257_03830 [Aphanomyces astaci]|eukprot:XP_009826398.1 hypothetical protein H257_03830 [Aphanomyces astaci]